MALGNGVLVHGPTAWACAVRTDDGELKVAAERKRLIGSRINVPLLRGPARLAEAFAVLPRLKRALPEAKLPFEGRGVLFSMAGTAAAVHVVRRSQPEPHRAGARRRPARGRAGGAVACAAARSRRYHGAEHIAIGTYEHGRADRARSTSAAAPISSARSCSRPPPANLLASRAPARWPGRRARLAASLGAVAASTEIFGWMTAQPRAPARAGARAARATSSSTGSRPPSRRRTSSRSPRLRSRRASSSKKTLEPSAPRPPLPMTARMELLAGSASSAAELRDELAPGDVLRAHVLRRVPALAHDEAHARASSRWRSRRARPRP